jgi:hypothetical protein
VDYVSPYNEDTVVCDVFCKIGVATGVAGSIGIGIDSTSANSADILTEYANGAASTVAQQAHARYRGFPGVGYHTLTWLEYARAGTVGYGGDDGVADEQSGILAEVMG